MARVEGNTIIIEDEPDRKCEMCGKIADCRPVGPNYEQICYSCGKKDPKGTEQRLHHFLEGLIQKALCYDPEQKAKAEVN